jgi:hypothetical protein
MPMFRYFVRENNLMQNEGFVFYKPQRHNLDFWFWFSAHQCLNKTQHFISNSNLTYCKVVVSLHFDIESERYVKSNID